MAFTRYFYSFTEESAFPSSTFQIGLLYKEVVAMARTTKRATRHNKSPEARTANASRSRSTHSNSPRLRVKYAEANRVRKLLRSEEVQMLTTRDVRTLLKILDDVYPVRSHRRSVWQPLLTGIAIGLLLLIWLVV